MFPKLSNIDKDMCEGPITFNEGFLSLNSMPKNKTPGKHCFPVEHRPLATEPHGTECVAPQSEMTKPFRPEREEDQATHWALAMPDMSQSQEQGATTKAASSSGSQELAIPDMSHSAEQGATAQAIPIQAPQQRPRLSGMAQSSEQPLLPGMAQSEEQDATAQAAPSAASMAAELGAHRLPQRAAGRPRCGHPTAPLT